MIIGIGIDVVEVARICSSHERFGGRFLQRVLLPDEIAYCLGYARLGPHVAVRFAAKEAVSKAFGTGLGTVLGWHDIEVRRRDSGEPYVVLHGRSVELLRQAGGDRVHLSLTHTEQYAAAVAILEGPDRGGR